MKSFYDTVNHYITIDCVLKLLPDNSVHPKTAEQIAKELGVNDGGTNPMIRKLITEAIQAGHLIGSSSLGYWQITTTDEYLNAISGLRNRVAGIESRIYNLQRNWENKCCKENSNQLRLF